MENVAELAEQIARSILQYDPDAPPADTNSPLFRDLVELSKVIVRPSEIGRHRQRWISWKRPYEIE